MVVRPTKKRTRERPDRVATWLGLAGVVLGATLAGVPTYLNNQNTISAQSSLAANAFVRDKRSVAYAEFIDKEQRLADLFFHYSEALGSPSAPPPQGVPEPLGDAERETLKKLKDPIVETNDALRHAQANLAIYGSNDAARISKQILAMYDWPTFLVSQAGDAPALTETDDGSVRMWDTNFGRLTASWSATAIPGGDLLTGGSRDGETEELRAEFIATGRRDFAVPSGNG
jgi:hypothetical protein